MWDFCVVKTGRILQEFAQRVGRILLWQPEKGLIAVVYTNKQPEIFVMRPFCSILALL